MSLQNLLHGIFRLLAICIVIIGGGYTFGPDVAAVVFRKGVQWKVGSPPSHLSLKAFDVKTADGLTISGWYRPGSVKSPVVILAHGILGDRRQMLRRANGMYDLDLTLVFFDLRGHGESSMDLREFGISENRDVRAVSAWASQKFPDRPIALYGYSLGGAATVLGEGLPEVDALILEAVFPTLASTIHNRVHFFVPVLGNWVERRLSDRVTDELGVAAISVSPLEAIRSVRVPTFTAGGALDPFVQASDSRALFDASGAKVKELVLNPCGSHNSVLTSADDDSKQQLIAFLQRTIGPFGRFEPPKPQTERADQNPQFRTLPEFPQSKSRTTAEQDLL